MKLFLFLLSTYLERSGSNKTLTAAETTQSQTSEEYPLTSMTEDLKNQNANCSPDVSRIGKEIKANQLNNFSYPKLKIGKKRGVFCPSNMKSGPGYIMTKLKIYIICKKANDYGMLNNIKVEDSFVKTEYANFKNTRSAETGFQKR